MNAIKTWQERLKDVPPFAPSKNNIDKVLEQMAYLNSWKIQCMAVETAFLIDAVRYIGNLKDKLANQDDDARCAARYRYLRDTMGYATTDPHEFEINDDAIDAAMKENT